MDMSPEAQTLQRENEDLLQFVYLMPVAVLRLDEQGQVVMLNPKAVQLLQDLDIDSGCADGLQIIAVLCPPMAVAWRATRGGTGSVMEPQRCSPQRANDSALHLLLQVVRVDERCTMLTIEDITSAVEHEREATRQRMRLALALEQIRGYGVVMLNGNGGLIEWNPSIGRLFGAGEREVQGRQLMDWLIAMPSDQGAAAPNGFEAIRRAIDRQGWCQLQAPWRRADGAQLWGDCMITPVVEADGGTSGYVAVVRDITQEHDRELQLLDQAQTDPLTGLCNRRGLERCVATLDLRLARGSGRPCWLMLDVDHFKRVNDTHGHESGDAVLRALAANLQESAREGEVVARLGGEEFVLLMPSVTEEAAALVAERLRGRVEALKVATGGTTVRVTASIGVALQGQEEDWSEALRRADAALYAAKRSGRNRVVLAVEPSPASG
jgi:diguanylate cyclase (GGDEF)-like protein/PAS domain S-box-containing protein